MNSMFDNCSVFKLTKIISMILCYSFLQEYFVWSFMAVGNMKQSNKKKKRRDLLRIFNDKHIILSYKKKNSEAVHPGWICCLNHEY